MDIKSQKNLSFVFAGCAGSGKSQTYLRLMEKVLPDASFNVIFSEEQASIVLSRKDERFDPKIHPLTFQATVSAREYAAERQAEKKAIQLSEQNGKKSSLLIFDRAIPDAYVYLSPKDAELVISSSLVDALCKYDAVIYFEPYKSADTKAGNEYRHESADELLDLARRTDAVWSQHPNVFRIPTFTDLDTKAEYVGSLINDILGENIFATTP